MAETIVKKEVPLVLLTLPGQQKLEIPEQLKQITVEEKTVKVHQLDLHVPGHKPALEVYDQHVEVFTTADAAWVHVQMAPWEPMAIGVQENGSTGYHWRVAGIIGNLTISEKFYPPVPTTPGKPGWRVFTLTPQEPGAMLTELQLLPPGRGAELAYALDIAVRAVMPEKQ